jgi:hypothetical protein
MLSPCRRPIPFFFFEIASMVDVWWMGVSCFVLMNDDNVSLCMYCLQFRILFHLLISPILLHVFVFSGSGAHGSASVALGARASQVNVIFVLWLYVIVFVVLPMLYFS